MQNSSIEDIRHSFAHLLAAAVQKLYPKVRLGIGPVIENGFYYDFGNMHISDQDLIRIEELMREIASQNLSFKKELWPSQKAMAYFKKKNQLFKQELIKDLKAKKVGMVYTGDVFLDLCRGGHVKNTAELPLDAFTLTKTAGAYWKGDEKRPQLTRIYGLAFASKKELEEHLAMLQEAEKRDHKKLGPQLELFFFHETAPGMPYWLPKGVTILNELIGFWREEHKQRGYQEIVSPILNKKELYITSGHYEHYWHEMFFARGKDDQDEYGVKAMNCPNAMVVFGSKLRSYKDLPFRLSDTDPLHRYERSGVLNALLRTREFRQDDAHCFITEEQIESEYQEIFKIVEKFYSIFHLDYEYRLGTRPEGFLGDKRTWDMAENTLQGILEKSGKRYAINKGDGAFYGPKVDIVMKDAIGRPWQMGTIQLDFQQPRRFKLAYIDASGEKKTPVTIHRVIYGSLERFIGLLIEHFAGVFPLWLAPEQVWVLPMSNDLVTHANEIKKELSHLRVSVREENETLGKKIREGEMQKIPYLLVIGKKEQESQTVSVRKHGKGDLGSMSLLQFVEQTKKEIERKE